MIREGAGLYDRLMAIGFVIEPVENKKALAQEKAKLEQQLREAQVFDIQNVVDYYISFHNQSPHWRTAPHWSTTDFPNIAPPFKSYFMQFKPPIEAFGKVHSAGVFSYAYDLQDKNPNKYSHLADSIDPPRWVVENTIFLENPKWKIEAYTRFFSAVQQNGKLYRLPNVGSDEQFAVYLPMSLDDRSLNDYPQKIRELAGEYIAAQAYRAYYPSLLALSFLHCKNVIVKAEEPQPKLSKTFQKKHGRPLVRFHVLDIDPMKTILRNEGQAEEVGLKRALHIVRGHFADYTEKGLFARNRGIYWFDQHARGTAEQGVVLKDYKVNTPQ